ncbi:type 1 glutamine amidotransferase [Aliiroseovarius sp. PTFE2010]|uniref:type 1 glutamine amidotransferase n=1 Tax=Aliiroseovarius sp. PTFE2010 TaxID=3417190 RepID=UPI003CF0E817
MHVGILECGHPPRAVAESQGEFDDMFHRLLGGHGFRFTTWDVEAGEFPDGPDAADAWLITGSRHGVYEDHAFIPPLEALIRAIFDAGLPMVGICFGHQIIAQAMGGRVEKFAGGWAIGARNYAFENIGNLRLNAFHHDQVIDKPPMARTVAASGFTRHAALVYGTNVLTVQPHPEFSPAVITAYLAARGDDPAYPRKVIEDARSTAADPVDDLQLGDIIARVLAAKPTPLTKDMT